MFRIKLSVITSMSASIAILSGCGGGGGGGAPAGTSPSTQFPIAAAISAYSQASHNFTLTAHNGANNYSVQIIQAPGAASSFNGTPASLTIAGSSIISVNGVATSTVNDISYLNISPWESIGDINQTNGQYTVYASQQTIPANATVGQGGALDTYTIYTNSFLNVVYATATETWSLSSDTASTVWACSNTTETVVGSSPSTFSTCYKIDTTGNVLATKLIIPVSGTTLTFQ